MRNELSTIEKIERYLQGSMSAEERNAFEKEIDNNPQLKAEVSLQKQLMQGLKTIALKNTAQKAYSKHKFGKGLKKWGGLGAGIIVVTAAAYFAWNHLSPGTNDRSIKISYELPELNENGEKLWADADKYLPYQVFSIDNSKDTVVETQDGIVMAVPAGCFLNADGSAVNGPVELEVKEAIESDDILMGGLSTRSGNTALETGGMFYLNARKDGENLKIDPAKGIVTQVPANEIKPGMQVYEGKRMPDGSIDWVAPKPLEKFLLPVNINTLNFYPPDYEDSLAGMGKPDTKIYKDSLYYSFASLFGDENPTASVAKADSVYTDTSWFSRNYIFITEVDYDDISKETKAKVIDELIKKYPSPMYATMGFESHNEHDEKAPVSIHMNVYRKTNVGINPAKVKTIWDNKFNNTILATKEFEERMQYIHLSCNNTVLDFYVNNLDKKLCTIDSLAAQLDEKFMEFAQRGDGRVKEEKLGHIEKLKRYYEQKQKAYTEAVAKTEKEFWKKQDKAQEKFGKASGEQSLKEVKRLMDNFVTEFKINYKEAARQLGYPNLIPANTYTVTVTIPGWKNLDRAVAEATATRTTLDYTDPLTGKKAMIKYEEVNVIIADQKNYDAVFVYSIPDQLNSFMRMRENNGIFTEKLNELMQHEMVSVAYKGDQAYFSYTEKLEPGKHEVTLLPVSKKELQQKLKEIKKYSNQQQLLDELSYRHIEQKEKIRQKQVNDLLQFRQRIERVIFPCVTINNSN